MQNPFGKKPIPSSVVTELERRGTRAGIDWNAKRFPWVVLTSLCSECPDNGQFTVLSSTKGALYEPGFVRPLPTIQSVDVKKQGELGTTKRATIKITAYTDQQLIGLQKCFFLPGMGVRIEWGWSIDTQNRPAPATVGDRNFSDARAICEMKKKEKNSPHYSGLQGIVANFGYSLTTDNYWDCTLEVIAAAESVSGAKVNTYNCGCKRENEVNNEQNKKEKVTRVESDIQAHLRDLQENYDSTSGKYRSEFTPYVNGTNIIIQRRYMKNMPQRNEAGEEASVGFWRGWGEYFTEKVSYESYISWGTLEAMINYLVMDLSKERIKTKFLGQVSSGGITLPWHPAVTSADPKICFIRGTEYWDETSVFEKGDSAPEGVVSVGNGRGVRLDNIMLNVIFVLGELRAAEQSDGSLISFLTNVLNKISDACGNLWAFEVVSTTESCEDVGNDKPPTIACIDIKTYEAAGPLTINTTAFGNGGGASIVRDFKLDMKMTEAMKTQALYSNGPIAKAKSPSGGNCDGDVFKAFNSDTGRAYNLAKGKPTQETASSDCGSSNKGEVQSSEDLSYNGVFAKLKEKGPAAANVTACKSLLIEAYNVTPSQFSVWRSSFLSTIFGDSLAGKRDHCKGVPLPFDFSFTIDGIGGLQFGQMVVSDRIPPQITRNFEWQVTTVEHSITVNDWTTTVNTVCRFKG
jgi:hypothetical protein